MWKKGWVVRSFHSANNYHAFEYFSSSFWTATIIRIKVHNVLNRAPNPDIILFAVNIFPVFLFIMFSNFPGSSQRLWVSMNLPLTVGYWGSYKNKASVLCTDSASTFCLFVWGCKNKEGRVWENQILSLWASWQMHHWTTQGCQGSSQVCVRKLKHKL